MRNVLALFALLVAVPAYGDVAAWTHLSTTTGDLPNANIGSQVGTLILDINRDGYNDFVIASYEKMVWYRFNPATRTWTKYALENGASGVSIEAGGDFTDIDGDGDLDIVQGAHTNGEIWWWENPYPNFSTGTPWTRHLALDTGGQHHDQIFGDFDNDGKQELAFYSSGMILAEIPANPKGTWSYTRIGDSGREGLAKGDVNRDGKLDLVGGGRWYQHVSGTTFITHNVDTGYGNSRSAVGDIIPGGYLEIVIGSGDTVGPLNLYQWNGSTWVKKTLIGTVDHGHALQVGDIDGDGHLDIFTGEMRSPGPGANCKTYILYGDGTGNFDITVLSTGIGAHESKIGDLDGDGDIDILQKDFQAQKRVDVWLNNDTGPGRLSLDKWTYIQVTNQHLRVFGLAFGDVTGDGRADIVSGRYVYKNPGGDMTGTWQRIDLGSTDALFVLDVDGDAFADIVSYNSSGLFWHEATNASGTAWTNQQVGAGYGADHSISSQGYRLGQIVSGGKNELLVSTDNEAVYYQIPANPAAGNWPSVVIATGTGGEGLAIGDVNRDGLNDVAGRLGGGNVVWWRNPGTGAGSWTAYAVGTTPNAADRISLADINGDGRLDLVVSEETGGASGAGTYWFEAPANPTSGSWTRRQIASQATTNSMEVADFDQDGDPDVVTGEHRGTEKVIIWENDAGAFTPHQVGAGKESHLGVRPFDLDGDGDLDIVSIAWDDYQYIHLWRNDAIRLPVPGNQTPVVDAGPNQYLPDLIPVTLAGAVTDDGKPDPPAAVTTQWSKISGPGTATFADASALSTTVTFGALGTYVLRLSAFDGELTGTDDVIIVLGPSSVPMTGLALWLMADAGVITSGSAVSQWQDQSGNANHASQSTGTSQPTLVANVINGLPVLRFDGTNDFLTFTLPVNGLNGMTIFLVTSCATDPTLSAGSKANSAAIFWNETASWGTVYLSPWQTIVPYRFGTGQTGNWPVYTRPSSIGASFTITTSMKNGAADYLWVDGNFVMSGSVSLTSIANCKSTGNIARGYNDNTYFPGDIAEVLVYTQALTETERQNVQSYLYAKYFATPADTTPPTPDPMTWASVPAAVSDTSITMTATTATDPSGVEYYFKCIAGDGHHSGWQASLTYTDTGLTPGVTYTYRVKARDLSANLNQTAYSTRESTTTLAADTTPPTPDPMTWASVPVAVSDTSITMTATTATDPSGVEYYFKCVDGGGHNSGWQASPIYTDTGLTPGATYTYRVKARDLSANLNQTAYSTRESTTTLAADTTPPTPDPMTWASVPAAVSDTSITMTATAATDPSGVEYYFKCVAGGGHHSGWQASLTYTDTGLTPGTTYTYRVKARDLSANLNQTAYSTRESATTPTAPQVTAALVGSTTTTQTAPQVTAVLVGSTTWSEAFFEAVDPGRGLGYPVPAGAGQLLPLPWFNIDQVSLVFSEDVNVADDDLSVYGVEEPLYSCIGVTYDPASCTATWTFDTPLAGPEKLRLVLADTVEDLDGQALDGEWEDGVSGFPSGDGVPGGAFEFRVNVLPGDANQNGTVQANDWSMIRAALLSEPRSANYTIYKDVIGNAMIQADDWSAARARLLEELPPGDPGP